MQDMKAQRESKEDPAGDSFQEHKASCTLKSAKYNPTNTQTTEIMV